MNGMHHTNVYITVDVEIWPCNWHASAASYVESFKRYIYGVGNPREYGLPFQLKAFADHGLKAVFFVEPLFSSVLGRGALEEVVGLIAEAHQEVQLHIHPEWLGRAGDERLPGPPRVSLRELSEDVQLSLLRFGLATLEECGARDVCAFRAGSFSANRATLRAVKRAGLRIDASHNAAAKQGPMDQTFGSIPAEYDGVLEMPLTVYRDAFARLRGLQIGSSGLGEMTDVCAQAADAGHTALTILSHSAELLNGARSRVDPVARSRFRGLCRFLERNSEHLVTQGFGDAGELTGPAPLPYRMPTVSIRASTWRYAQQAIRRLI